MSYMTNFKTAEDFHGFMCHEIRNLAYMTESAYPDPMSSSPGASAGNDVTAIEPSYPIVDPSILLPFSGDFTGPGNSVDPGTAHRSISRRRVGPHHALAHHTGAHHQYIPQGTVSSSYFLPAQLSTRVDESAANGQIVRTPPQSRQRKISTSEDGTQADSMQDQPPKKRQRKSRTRRNTAMNGAAIGKAQEISEVAKCDEAIGVALGYSEYRGPRVRLKDEAMEWFDMEDSQWKPAGYHRDYRAEFIAMAAQQPGAPSKLFKPQFLATELMEEVWTEDMGTNFTSHSPLIHGWTKDPTSVVDSKGRHVFSMKKPPADWIQNPKYSVLIYNGLVMLDHDDYPIQDIPGLPLTLETRAPAWLLEGLRRCTKIPISDLRARFPAATRETPTGTKATTITQRIGRWLAKNEIKQWHERPNSKVKEPPPAAAEIDDQGSEPVKGVYLPTFGPQLSLDGLNSGLSNRERFLSVDVSNQQAFKHGSTQSSAGPYLFDNEDSQLPSQRTSALAELCGSADTGHSPIPEFYNSHSSLHRAPAYSDGHFESKNHAKRNSCGRSRFDIEYPVQGPNNRTGMPIPCTESGNTHEANHDSNLLNLSNFYGQQSSASLMLMEKAEYLDRSGTNMDAQNSLFDGGDFRYILPKNAAEIAFVKSALDYTRAEYKSWMSVEPPESSYFASYAEQYCEMQEHLEKTWSFSSFPPIKLRALGPVSGGLNQW